jgi:hypothetical protein
VDSCVDRMSPEPPVLAYLRSMGFDPSVDVVQVVATHWHDDHVRGLADVVNQCRSARFACSAALGSREFVTLAEAQGYPISVEDDGVAEFRRVLNTLAERAAPVILASGDRPLWRSPNGEALASQVVALSPSDEAIRRAILEIVNLMPDRVGGRRIPELHDNLGSVAVWIQVGARAVLLGADLERRADPLLGWEAILASITRPVGRCQAYKVAHHGSANGHHDGVWEQLLEPGTRAVLAPWTRGGRVVPSDVEVRSLCELTQHAYAASPIHAPGNAQTDRRVERVLRQAVRYVRDIEGPLGQVRLRAPAQGFSSAPRWSVELFGAAVALCA